MQTDTQQDARKHLQELLMGFTTAMLVTAAPTGHMHARPMRVAEIADNGDILFATSVVSPKAKDVEEHSEALVAFQGGNAFASVRGAARISRDRALIDRLWSEAWKVWFPKGKDDSHLCILIVDAQGAEYWDTTGAQGVKYIFEAAKAYLAGRKPETDRMQNAKVQI